MVEHHDRPEVVLRRSTARTTFGMREALGRLELPVGGVPQRGGLLVGHARLLRVDPNPPGPSPALGACRRRSPGSRALGDGVEAQAVRAHRAGVVALLDPDGLEGVGHRARGRVC